MHIDAYHFGEIVIDGKSYLHDVSCHPKGIQANWFRREGHGLALGDIGALLDRNCKTLIVGTGASGMMHVLPEVVDLCHKAGIELITHATAEAVKHYNSADPATTVGAFHLTC